MRRMTLAIERAIKRPTRKEKERAARWAAAWGLLCGIRTEGVKLKAGDIQNLDSRLEQTSDSTATFGSFSWHELNEAVQLHFSPSTSSPVHLPVPSAHSLTERPPAEPKPV
jgi:hypothetical protein